MFYYKAAMTATEWDAEMAKHKFIISYDEDEVAAGGETLNLYVNHVITETEDENNSRTSTTVDYKAYDISHIVSSNLKKIVLHACASSLIIPARCR